MSTERASGPPNLSAASVHVRLPPETAPQPDPALERRKLVPGAIVSETVIVFGASLGPLFDATIV